jgi:hypothetical protein
MYSHLNELNEYSVEREMKKAFFEKLVYEKKASYLKYSKYGSLNVLKNPLEFNHLVLDENKIEVSVDSSSFYPVSLEDERLLITKKALNLGYLREMNLMFNSCRSVCQLPDARVQNINLNSKTKQHCVTDCLNVKSELSGISKPNNNQKTFIWLA